MKPPAETYCGVAASGAAVASVAYADAVSVVAPAGRVTEMLPSVASRPSGREAMTTT